MNVHPEYLFVVRGCYTGKRKLGCSLLFSSSFSKLIAATYGAEDNINVIITVDFNSSNVLYLLYLGKRE